MDGINPIQSTVHSFSNPLTDSIIKQEDEKIVSDFINKANAQRCVMRI